MVGHSGRVIQTTACVTHATAARTTSLAPHDPHLFLKNHFFYLSIGVCRPPPLRRRQGVAQIPIDGE